MPAARGLKRTASKASAAAASTGPKSKKKRGGVQLEVPVAPKKRGRVLACGQGDVGQLGLGEDVVETTKYKFVVTLGDRIVDICAGGMHSVALDIDGKVWTFGCNDEGALGRATAGESEEGTPTAVALPRRAVAITAGDSHTAALLDNGDVYAWGAFRDSHGSMGLVVQGRAGKPCRDPVHINIGEPAADMASGGDHLVILTTSGAVYTMGCGEQGQLGRLSQRSASRDARQGFSALLVPCKVTLKGGASRVWAGYHATFALDGAGDKMLAWGLNNYGQLGISGEKRKAALYSPTECDAFGAVGAGWGRVACGQHHSLAVDGGGTCYALGRCEYGRLGLGDRTGDAETLEPIPKLQGKKCVSIAAGTSSSFAVTDNGEIYAWGMGSEGQLGTGNTEDAAAPARVTGPALEARGPLRVCAGGQHSLLLVGSTSEPESTSRTPERETGIQRAGEKDRDKKLNKRQKKTEEETQVTSTSAQPVQIQETTAPVPKVNGDEAETAPMEVDDADKPDDDTKPDKSKDNDTTTDSKDKTEEPVDSDVPSEEKSKQNIKLEEKNTEQLKEPQTKETAPINDIEMVENESETVNGSPERTEIQEKTKMVADETIQSDTAITSA